MESEIEDMVVCDDCGRTVWVECCESDDFGNHVCHSCYNAHNWTTCGDCGELLRENEGIEAEDTNEVYCEDCVDEHLCRCDDCGYWYEHRHIITDEDTHICHDCYDANWHTCTNCGCLIHDDDTYWYCDDPYCNRCYDMQEHDDMLHDYSYKPTPIFHRCDGDTAAHPLYFGVELELSHDSNDDFDASYNCFKRYLDPNDTEDYFYLKKDSSLQNGYEIVSHPMTLARWHEMSNTIDNFFYDVDDWCISSRDGLHVHISRKGMTIPHMIRFGTFIAAEQDNVIIIARRDSDEWARYHAKPKTGIDCNRLCRSSTRYQAVNWQNSKTVELRVFASTVNLTDFYAAIEFAHATYVFTKSYVTIQQIMKGSWDLFMQYLRDNKKQYAYLLKYWDENVTNNKYHKLVKETAKCA